MALISAIDRGARREAMETQAEVGREGGHCLVIEGDAGDEAFCARAVDRVLREYGSLDVLVNHAGLQHPLLNPEELPKRQLLKAFEANIFSYFNMTKAALPGMKEGASIINSASVTACRGSARLLRAMLPGPDHDDLGGL